MIRKSRWSYINEVIGPTLKDNPKAFYNYIKRARQETTGIDQLRSDGELRRMGRQKRIS